MGMDVQPRTNRPWWRRAAERLMGIAKGLLASARSPEGVFTEIYRKNIWGGAPGSIHSGGGTHDETVTAAYLGMLALHAEECGFQKMSFVDLGCGDMAVGRRLIPLCASYIGVDVVRYVIESHREEFVTGHVTFIHADIVADPLPDGDVCFVRQVFQHLSNAQIARVLPKLRKYCRVYITEHVLSGCAWLPNADKPHGASIRLAVGSGVDITKAPFGVPADEVSQVLDVVGNSTGGEGDAGIIRTVLYTPGRRITG